MSSKRRPAAEITAAQCRAARGLLGWSRLTLAGAASILCNRIDTFESGRHKPKRETVDTLRRSMEVMGVVFLAEDCTQGAGVRLGKTLLESETLLPRKSHQKSALDNVMVKLARQKRAIAGLS